MVMLTLFYYLIVYVHLIFWSQHFLNLSQVTKLESICELLSYLLNTWLYLIFELWKLKGDYAQARY